MLVFGVATDGTFKTEGPYSAPGDGACADWPTAEEDITVF